METITVTNPSPGGGTSQGVTFVVNPATVPGVTVVSLLANSLAWDPANKVIYLSLPSIDGVNGNTVQVLDPNTDSLGKSVFAGSEPYLLSVSPSSKYLYVSQAGASTLQRFTLPDLLSDITIPLGSDSFDGPFYAMDMQASPSADATVAVVRGTPSYSPEEEGGVLIYDDGTQRPDVLCGWIESGCPNVGTGLYDSIQWSSDGSEMFAANYEDTAFDFYTIPVTAAGLGTPTDYPGLVPGFFFFIHYDSSTGYVYDDDGGIINPATGTVVGTFAASGLMIPDGTLGRAFFIGQTQANSGGSTYTIESFDIHHFTPISTLTIKNVNGFPTKLIRWGANGLAFTTYNPGATSASSAGSVYIINSSFVGGAGANSTIPIQENVQLRWKPRNLLRSMQAPKKKSRAAD
jgi:hypothetical protein